MALRGAARGTIDLDLVISLSLDNLENAEKALQGLGFQSRIPVSAREVFENRERYISERNLIAWNFYNPKKLIESVDILIAYDLKSMDSTLMEIGKCWVPVLTLDSIIAMKSSSDRPQDAADIAALKSVRSR